jgi:P27 family predicted phage terminase small subunit
MRGRKPTPTEKRVLEGNPQKRPLPEVLLVAGRPELQEFAVPPDYLPLDAQEFWRDSVVRLVDVGIIDRVDYPALEQLAVQYARIRQAQRVIREEGLFTLGSVGQIREHPALKIEREATTLFMKMAEHFALTPIARTRLGLAELHRRTLADEMGSALGTPKLTPIVDAESTAVES